MKFAVSKKSKNENDSASIKRNKEWKQVL